MVLEVRETTSKDKEAWIRAPYRFYDDLPAHRPLPDYWLRDLFAGRGAFAEHVAGLTFLAVFDDDRIVGRMAVCLCPAVGDKAGEMRAIFGLFEIDPEAPDDATRILFEEGRERARKVGANRLVGPIAIHPLFSMGTMVSDFDRTAPVLMQHSHPRHAELLDTLGPTKTQTLQTWRWSAERPTPAPVRQIAEATRAHPGLKLRPIKAEGFRSGDAEVISELYNDAYYDTLGYRPLDPAEMSWILRDGDAIDRRCSSIAEIDGEPAAMVIALPNINAVGLTAAEHERPWASFQERLLQAFKTPDTVRVFLFGVRQAYRGRAVGGLASLMWHEFARRAEAAEYVSGETAQVLAGDVHRSNALRAIGLRPGRRSRLYTFEV